MALYSAIQKFITKNGAPVIGASCLVLVDGSATQPTLYATRTGGALSNPFPTDSQGNAICYVAPGRYKMIVTKGAEQVTFEGIEVGPVSLLGSFVDGGIVSDPDQWFADARGNQWAWSGALNKTVAPGEDPAAVAGWVLMVDKGLRGDLASGLADVKFANGSPSAPSVAFASDPDTGFFRKAANSLGFSTSGVERMNVSPEGFIGIGVSVPTAKLHVEVNNDISAGARFKATWQGSTGNNYQNNDVIFMETYNKVLSNSENWSWAISSSNAYHDIPAGVTDSGFRVGVLGWAVSVNSPGFTHAGALAAQYGVYGRAGFQGGGAAQSPSSAVIQRAVGVRGQIVHDSPGATIQEAYAGRFEAFDYAVGSNIQDNVAVWARAVGGISSNYSFYGVEGTFYNFGKSFFNSLYSDIDSRVVSRVPINSFEFGFPDVGYGSALGSTPGQGYPFLALCCSTDATGDTFKTQGFAGSVVYNNLEGSTIFAVVPSVNAAGQAPIEAFRVTPTAGVKFSNPPQLPTGTPGSATAPGSAGMITWDADYVYVCVATNTWKRTALAAW